MLVLDKLDHLTFCKGMPNEYQRRLYEAGEIREYQPRERLFFEGQSSKLIYVLIEGKVVLETSLPGEGPVPLQTVGAGELLGWSPVLELGVMTATAQAVTHCYALALNAERILAVAEEDPRFMLEVMRRVAITLARRLNATRLQLVESCRDVTQVVS